MSKTRTFRCFRNKSDVETERNSQREMNDFELFNYLITFEDDMQIVSYYLWIHKGYEYILAREYTDESESGDLLVLKCLEDGYLEFVSSNNEKCDALMDFANKIGSCQINDVKEALAIIGELIS